MPPKGKKGKSGKKKKDKEEILRPSEKELVLQAEYVIDLLAIFSPHLVSSRLDKKVQELAQIKLRVRAA